MFNDRELLEFAANAAGMDIDPARYDDAWGFALKRTQTWWNPLTDDGDALRLAAKLRLGIEFNETSVVVSWVDGDYESKETYEYPDQTQDEDFNIVYINHNKAARLAIVRAASEIGRQMQGGGAA